MKKKQKRGKHLKVFSIKKNSVMNSHQNGITGEQSQFDENLIQRVAKKLVIAAQTPERNTVHIISRGNDWVIKREGAQKVYRICDTQTEAILIAKGMIKKGLAERIIVHDDDGTVAKRM